MAMELVDSPVLLRNGHVLESVSYGGGPASAELGNTVRKAFPLAAPGQGYGATELSSACANVTGEDFLARASRPFSCLIRQLFPPAVGSSAVPRRDELTRRYVSFDYRAYLHRPSMPRERHQMRRRRWTYSSPRRDR